MGFGMKTAVALLYPPRCLSCGTQVESDFGLCPSCWPQTPFITGTVCDLCGMPVPGAADGHQIVCDDCLATPRPWDAGRSALLYDDHARRLVLALKHGDRHDIAQPAARWMARAVRPLVTPETLVVPVPMHWTRLARRRYNQSALLSAALANALDLPHCPDALVRSRRTPTLDGRGSDTRFRTLAGAIEPHPRRGQRMHGRPVLIVDDVMTSGATLAAAALAAKEAGASQVCVGALARVAKDT